jgi:U32 family peptidase
MTASPALETAAVPAPSRLRKPELLAPAGDRECLRAAIENGADAVYFGLTHGFNARARATNLDLAALPEIMAELHHRGVKGYVTLNTLVFTNELPEVELTVRELATAGVDAVLVQDLGLVRLIRSICPDLSIHASTQMTLTSARSTRFTAGPTSSSKLSFTERSASHTPASASPANRWGDAAPTVDSAPRPADSLTN